MGAPQRSSHPEASGLPKLNEYGRDPKSLMEKCSRVKGYGPLYHSDWPHLPRLMPGGDCWSLVIAVAQLGQWELKYTWTEHYTLEEWAGLCGCTVREIQRNRDYLKSRGMVDVQTDIKRRVSFKLTPKDWKKLEDYKIWYAKQKPISEVPEETEEEPPPEDPAESDAKTSTIVIREQTVTKRTVSKPYVVNCGVKTFRFDFDLPVDCTTLGVVKAGEFVFIVRAVKSKSKQIPPQIGVSAIRNQKDTKIADDVHVIGVTSVKSQPSGKSLINPASKQHPRGPEIASILDPLILPILGKSLSGNPTVLYSACDAVGSTPPEYIVKFVTERLERGLTGLKVIVSILRDCKGEWERLQKLGAPAQRVTAKTMKKTAADEILEGALARLEKRNRRL